MKKFYFSATIYGTIIVNGNCTKALYVPCRNRGVFSGKSDEEILDELKNRYPELDKMEIFGVIGKGDSAQKRFVNFICNECSGDSALLVNIADLEDPDDEFDDLLTACVKDIYHSSEVNGVTFMSVVFDIYHADNYMLYNICGYRNLEHVFAVINAFKGGNQNA